MYPATTCDCCRKFNSLWGSRIHKARWCKQRNSPAGECKSNDGPMNQVYPHSIHKPIAEHQHPGDIPCSQEFSSPRVIRYYLDKLRPGAFFLLTTHLEGPIDQQITSFSRIIYDVCLECFCTVTHKKNKTEGKWTE